MFLRHARQQLDGDHLRLDTVKTHVPGQLDGNIELGLEDRDLMVYRNGELGQMPPRRANAKGNAEGTIDADFSKHSVRESTEIEVQF